MTFSGEGDRGSSIFGENPPPFFSVTNGLPSLKLAYANGPEAFEESPRADPFAKGDPLTDKDYVQQSKSFFTSASHSGDDVALYARGPFAHLFRGTLDNTYPFHAAAFALCLPVPVSNYETTWDAQRQRNSPFVRWQNLALVIDPRQYPHCRRSFYRHG